MFIQKRGGKKGKKGGGLGVNSIFNDLWYKSFTLSPSAPNLSLSRG